MASKYYVTLTAYGSDLIAQAHESTPLNFKNLVKAFIKTWHF